MNFFKQLKRPFLHGCDYNPEQWKNYPDILNQDIEYMKKAHINVVSIGIFSWASLEPSEGVYDFEFFDYIVDKLSNNGIKIILATPSGAKPRWLAEKYPEVQRVNKDNRRELYGFRHNHCYTSPIYRKKVAQINKELARRYGDNPNIILWHISNEYGGECHCELCQSAFRDYLYKKYNGSLDELNHAWWAAFWSHSISEWSQIHSPVSIGENDNVMHGLFLDWKEFVTYQTTDFMNAEIASIRSVCDKIPTTTNFMGPYQGLNYHYMKDFVDIISWDSYPSWHSERGDTIEAYSIAFAHDLHRCFLDKPFLLMESTPSLTNWLPINKLKRPNMHILSSLQAIAHGSDSVQYFQWRKSRGGQEKFHGAVVDHDMSDTARVFKEVSEIGEILEKLGEVCNTSVESEVGIVYEFCNRHAIDNAMGFCNDNKKYKRTCINLYKEFWKRGINTDVISIDKELSKYKLLVLPMLYSISEKQIDALERYVANGGTVVATYMTGYVNESDLCYLGGFPGGKLKDVFGIVANEIDSLYATDYNSVIYNGKSHKCIDYCELITPTTAKVLGTYESDFYKSTPALTKNSYLNGSAYYIAARDEGSLTDALFEDVLREIGIEFYNLPNGVTMHKRGECLFVENYTDECKSVNIDTEYIDLVTGEKYKKTLNLNTYEIKTLKYIQD